MLTSPGEVCEGQEIVFTCQQRGAIASWDVTLPSGMKLYRTVRNTQDSTAGPLHNQNDPRTNFGFTVQLLSSSNNSIVSQLRVFAVRELDCTSVMCTGATGLFITTIKVGLLGE